MQTNTKKSADFLQLKVRISQEYGEHLETGTEV